MFISLIVIIVLQCICISNPHVVYLKYMQFLFVCYTLIKVGGEEKLKEKALATPGLTSHSRQEEKGYVSLSLFSPRKVNVCLKGHPLSQWAFPYTCQVCPLTTPHPLPLQGLLGEQAFLSGHVAVLDENRLLSKEKVEDGFGVRNSPDLSVAEFGGMPQVGNPFSGTYYMLSLGNL